MSAYFDWTKPIFLDQVYFGGRFFNNLNEDSAGPLVQTDPPGIVLVPTHAGTAIPFAPYRGADKPLAAGGSVFSVAMLADDESDFYWMLGLRSQGAGVYYCPGLPAADSFQAVSGNAYQLTRAQASGIVPGVTTAPTILLAGVETPGAASVSGRTVSATASGLLTIWYMPVYTVCFTAEVVRTISVSGQLVLNTTLAEVVI